RLPLVTPQDARRKRPHGSQATGIGRRYLRQATVAGGAVVFCRHGPLRVLRGCWNGRGSRPEREEQDPLQATSLRTIRTTITVMLSVPPASRASCSRFSQALFAEVIERRRSRMSSSGTCLVSPSEHRSPTLFQSFSMEVTTGADSGPPNALESTLASGGRTASLLRTPPRPTRPSPSLCR